MISISSIFKDVLLKEDNITVPGLGTLEATYQPAQLDEKTGVIYPPTKLVKLNTDKTDDSNDTLLKYVVEAYKVSDVDAKAAIEAFVKDVKDKVASKSIVTLEDVGTIQQGEGGAIVLKAMPSKLSIDNYGMDSVEVEPVPANERVAAAVTTNTSRGKVVKSDAPRAAAATTKVSTTKVTTTKTTTTTKSEKEKKEKSKFPWWLVCLLAFVAVLTVLFFIYKDTVMGWFGNDKPVATTTEQPANDPTKPGKANDGKTTTIDTPADKTNRPSIDSDLEILAQAGFSNVSPQNLGPKYKKYYLIGGSYRDPQRANERKRAVGGKEVLNVDGSDLFRVVIAGSDNATEIVEEYNKALKRGVKPAEIWLLKNSK
jgi:nucleoid DNA-binding protein